MGNALNILLIEDDADDAELLRDAFENNDISNSMHVINDGAAVLPYLQEIELLPNIVVMDLNLPKVHGRDLLKEIRSDAKFSHVPVVILTTSSSPEDKASTLSLGASEYLIKPTTSRGLYEVATRIADIAAHATI